jgi:hypothetical protein
MIHHPYKRTLLEIPHRPKLLILLKHPLLVILIKTMTQKSKITSNHDPSQIKGAERLHLKIIGKKSKQLQKQKF